MSFIDYSGQSPILVMTKGHPFARDEFFRVFEEMDDVNATAVEQPASQAFFHPELARDYRAFVLYDMPGMDFQSLDASDGLAPAYMAPPEPFKRNFLALLEQGHGFVFLHHSIAAWPGWPEYAEIVGGKFLYKPDDIRGKRFADSGYRHGVEHQVSIVEKHPVTAGLEDTFTITDELYLGHVFSDAVRPILASDYDFTEKNFYSAQQAVQGNMFCREDWHHPEGSNIIGWYKHYLNSPIVYLQCGDDPAAYANPSFNRLLANAIGWVSSEQARDWARAQT